MSIEEEKVPGDLARLAGRGQVGPTDEQDDPADDGFVRPQVAPRSLAQTVRDRKFESALYRQPEPQAPDPQVGKAGTRSAFLDGASGVMDWAGKGLGLVKEADDTATLYGKDIPDVMEATGEQFGGTREAMDSALAGYAPFQSAIQGAGAWTDAANKALNPIPKVSLGKIGDTNIKLGVGTKDVLSAASGALQIAQFHKNEDADPNATAIPERAAVAAGQTQFRRALEARRRAGRLFEKAGGHADAGGVGMSPAHTEDGRVQQLLLEEKKRANLMAMQKGMRLALRANELGKSQEKTGVRSLNEYSMEKTAYLNDREFVPRKPLGFSDDADAGKWSPKTGMIKDGEIAKPTDLIEASKSVHDRYASKGVVKGQEVPAGLMAGMQDSARLEALDDGYRDDIEGGRSKQKQVAAARFLGGAGQLFEGTLDSKRMVRDGRYKTAYAAKVAELGVITGTKSGAAAAQAGLIAGTGGVAAPLLAAAEAGKHLAFHAKEQLGMGMQSASEGLEKLIDPSGLAKEQDNRDLYNKHFGLQKQEPEVEQGAPNDAPASDAPASDIPASDAPASDVPASDAANDGAGQQQSAQKEPEVPQEAPVPSYDEMTADPSARAADIRERGIMWEKQGSSAVLGRQKRTWARAGKDILWGGTKKVAKGLWSGITGLATLPIHAAKWGWKGLKGIGSLFSRKKKATPENSARSALKQLQEHSKMGDLDRPQFDFSSISQADVGRMSKEEQDQLRLQRVKYDEVFGKKTHAKAPRVGGTRQAAKDALMAKPEVARAEERAALREQLAPGKYTPRMASGEILDILRGRARADLKAEDQHPGGSADGGGGRGSGDLLDQINALKDDDAGAPGRPNRSGASVVGDGPKPDQPKPSVSSEPGPQAPGPGKAPVGAGSDDVIEQIDTSSGNGGGLPAPVDDPLDAQSAAFDDAFGSSARDNYYLLNEGAQPGSHLQAAAEGYFPVRRPGAFDPQGAEADAVRRKADLEGELSGLPQGDDADMADAAALRDHRARQEDHDRRLEEFERSDPGAFEKAGQERMRVWDAANPRPVRPKTTHDQRVGLQGEIAALRDPKEIVAQKWSAHRADVDAYRRRQQYLGTYAPGSNQIDPDLPGFERAHQANIQAFDSYRQGGAAPSQVAGQPGQGPAMNQLIDGQWQEQPEEEKGAGPVPQGSAKGSDEAPFQPFWKGTRHHYGPGPDDYFEYDESVFKSKGVAKEDAGTGAPPVKDQHPPRPEPVKDASPVQKKDGPPAGKSVHDGAWLRQLRKNAERREASVRAQARKDAAGRSIPKTVDRPAFNARPSMNGNGALESSGRREYPFGENEVPIADQDEASTSERLRAANPRRSSNVEALFDKALPLQGRRLQDLTEEERAVGIAAMDVDRMRQQVQSIQEKDSRTGGRLVGIAEADREEDVELPADLNTPWQAPGPAPRRPAESDALAGLQLPPPPKKPGLFASGKTRARYGQEQLARSRQVEAMKADALAQQERQHSAALDAHRSGVDAYESRKKGSRDAIAGAFDQAIADKDVTAPEAVRKSAFGGLMWETLSQVYVRDHMPHLLSGAGRLPETVAAEQRVAEAVEKEDASSQPFSRSAGGRYAGKLDASHDLSQGGKAVPSLGGASAAGGVGVGDMLFGAPRAQGPQVSASAREDLATLTSNMDASHAAERAGMHQAAEQVRADQGDAAMPMPGLRPEADAFRAPFFNAYWNREIQHPNPTRQATHSRKVRFDDSVDHQVPMDQRPPDRPFAVRQQHDHAQKLRKRSALRAAGERAKMQAPDVWAGMEAAGEFVHEREKKRVFPGPPPPVLQQPPPQHQAPQQPPASVQGAKLANEEEKGNSARPLPGANTGRAGEVGDGAENLPSARRIDDLFRRGRSPVVPYDDAAFANRMTPAFDVYDDERAKYQADLRAEGFQDVSTRHENLDLPSAFMHVLEESEDLPDWVSSFSGPGGELDIADSPEGATSGGYQALSANDVHEERQARAVRRAAVPSNYLDDKRVLDTAGSMTPDALGQAGPITVDGREVYPQYPNRGRDADRPFGGHWRHADTGQRVQDATVHGAQDNPPYAEFHGPAIPAERVLQVPAPGWDAQPKKPGLLSGKGAKESYAQAKQARAGVVRSAFNAYQRKELERPPGYIGDSEYARKEWRRLDAVAAEEKQRALMRQRGVPLF